MDNPAAKIIGSKWISATSTKNFMLYNNLADLIGEYLKRINPATIGKNSKNNNQYSKSTQFLMEQGNLFEKKVFDFLKNKFAENEYIDLKGNIRSVVDFERTKQSIEQSIPIIFGGVLHDVENKTYGLPDILVREDYLEKIFNNINFPNNEKNNRSLRKIPYAVIDVKFSTLPLTANGMTILNSGFFPFYKAQIEVYRRIVNKISNANYKYGFILGRGWQYTTKGEYFNFRDPFDRPGIIDYHHFDNVIISKTNDAIKWVKYVKTLKTDTLVSYFESCNLKNTLPCFPNMCVTNDPYHISQFKSVINKEICDITQIWMCGYKHRLKAHELGITGWDDKRFNAQLIGFRGKIAKTIDNIIEVNRITNNRSIILPQRLSFPVCKSDRIFIDFEVLSDITCDGKFSNQSIFMIGIGYEKSQDNGAFIFKTFSSCDFSSDGENRICKEFVNYLVENNLQNRTFIHWSSAENWQWENARKRLSHNTNLKLFDLCKFFQDNSIAVYGCFNFSLKNIAKSMKNLNFIESSWDDSLPSDGLDAVVSLYTSSCFNRSDIEMKNIEKYNYIDVKVLHEICNYFDLYNV